MIKFRDGPAAGVTLMLHRAPQYLRVVRAGRKAWDALDQLDDQPEPGESITVYRIDPATFSRYHLLCRRPRGGSGWYCNGEYDVVEPQPGEEHLRTTAAWQAWVSSQPSVVPA